MFAYCGNNPIMGLDPTGRRTYVLNGIWNENDDSVPDEINKFTEELQNQGVVNVVPIPVYTGQSGLSGLAQGAYELGCEMLNCGIYTNMVLEYVESDLAANPLSEGEQINFVGYSGGGQVCLNVAEKLGVPVDNIVLIGSPVMEIYSGSAKVTMVFGGLDPFFSVGGGLEYCFTGFFWNHFSYFYDENINRTASLIADRLD